MYGRECKTLLPNPGTLVATSNTLWLTAWLLWSNVVSDWSDCLCFHLSINENSYIWHVSIRTGLQSDGRRPAGGGSVMIRAVFCGDTPRPCYSWRIYFDMFQLPTRASTLLPENTIPNICCCFQQDNAACRTVKMVQGLVWSQSCWSW